MIQISAHARRRMKEKNIAEEDVLNTIHDGEEAYENISEQKRGSRMGFGNKYLIVIWRQQSDDIEVVIVYWRNRKLPKYTFIE